MSASDQWQELDICQEIAEHDQREADRLAGHAPASPKGNDARLAANPERGASSMRGSATPRSRPAHPPGTEHVKCPTCHGNGETYTNPSPIGDPQCVIAHVCPTCDGNGALPAQQEQQPDALFHVLAAARHSLTHAQLLAEDLDDQVTGHQIDKAITALSVGMDMRISVTQLDVTR